MSTSSHVRLCRDGLLCYRLEKTTDLPLPRDGSVSLAHRLPSNKSLRRTVLLHATEPLVSSTSSTAEQLSGWVIESIKALCTAQNPADHTSRTMPECCAQSSILTRLNCNVSPCAVQMRRQDKCPQHPAIELAHCVCRVSRRPAPKVT
jgi:hypothetical protein